MAKDHKKQLVVNMYKESLGNISVTCTNANISRQTFHNWRNKDDDFAQSLIDVEERNLDFAETQLLKAIKAGKTIELLFFLKTKGKRRGYYEKQEIEHTFDPVRDITIQEKGSNGLIT